MNFTDDDNGINNDMSRWMDKRVYQLEMKSGAAPRSATVPWHSFSVTSFFYRFQNFPIDLTDFYFIAAL